MTFEAIVDAAVAAFDVAQSTAVGWVNNRRSRMMSEAEFLTKVATIGSTVAGTATYNIPAGNINLRYIQIGTQRFDPVSPDDLWDIEGSRARDATDGSTRGLAAVFYDSSDQAQVKLRPAPSATGTAINAIQTHAPTALTYASNTPTGLPDHLDPYLLDGVMAEGYERSDERQDAAQLHEQRFQQGIQLLHRFKNARLKSSGPYRITVGR